MLLLFMGVPVADIVIAKLASIPAAERATPQVHTDNVPLESLFGSKPSFTVRTLEGFIRVFSMHPLHVCHQVFHSLVANFTKSFLVSFVDVFPQYLDVSACLVTLWTNNFLLVMSSFMICQLGL